MIIHIDISNWIWLVISIFSVWRLTSLLCYESGPFNLFNRIRKLFYKIGLGKIIECFHCTGLWVSIFIILLIYEFNIALVFLILAVSGASSIIERKLNS
jgi:hypothetical protein